MNGKPKEHPIIFSSEMVRAILEGRKSRTRRPIRPQPDPFAIYAILNEDPLSKKPHLWISGYGDGNIWKNPEFDPWFSCPYRLGDVLWVKETWRLLQVFEDWWYGGWDADIYLGPIPKEKPDPKQLAVEYYEETGEDRP